MTGREFSGKRITVEWSKNSPRYNPSQVKCYNCNKEGHLARDCPHHQLPPRFLGCNFSPRRHYHSHHHSHHHHTRSRSRSRSRQPHTRSPSRSTRRRSRSGSFRRKSRSKSTRRRYPTPKSRSRSKSKSRRRSKSIKRTSRRRNRSANGTSSTAISSDPSTRGYLLICGSRESGNGGDLTCVGTVLQQILASGVPRENIRVIADIRWLSDAIKEFNCTGRLHIGDGIEYISFVTEFLKGVPVSSPGAKEVIAAFDQLTDNANIKQVAVWYWNHGDESGMSMPNQRDGLTIPALTLLFGRAVGATKRKPAEGGAMGIAMFFSACASTAALAAAMSLTIAKDRSAKFARVAVVTTSDGNMCTWNTLFVEDKGVWYGGLAQSFRAVCRLSCRYGSDLAAVTFVELADLLNGIDASYRITVLQRGNEIVGNWFDTRKRLGDVVDEDLPDDRKPLPGTLFPEDVERVRAVRLKSGGSAGPTSLTPEQYKRWQALRGSCEESERSHKFDVDIVQLVVAVGAQEKFKGYFSKTATGAVPNSLILSVLTQFRNSIRGVYMLRAFMPGIEKKKYTEQDVIHALVKAAEGVV